MLGIPIDTLIEILTWTAGISGGMLILLLLLSILGGLDLDIDIGHGDIGGGSDTGHGGDLGLLKAGLAFLAIGAWVFRIILMAEKHPFLACFAGLASGAAAVYLLKMMLRFLLNNDVDANWSPDESLLQEAKVYLRIPAEDGTGLIHVDIKGATRELKAVSADQTPIATGERVVIQDIKDEVASVIKIDSGK